MEVYKAIEQMRTLSRQGRPFAFAYMSYSIARHTSEGIISVRRARLTKQNRRERNRYTDYMLSYIDLDTGERRSCWQPLLLEFNGQQLELK